MQLPRPFGPFRLTERLGAGATASVYCAERAGTRYALKLPKLEVELAPHRLERLRREVELAGRLEHPQLAACLEAGRIEDRLYLLLPLVDGGQHLDRAWASTPLPTRLEHLRQVADAVGHAHARGVVHRDLKPQNVLVGADGRAYVTDLGAAALSEAQPGLALTRSGDVVGTPSYAPPEHLRGGSRDAAPTADVWALGILLHLALCDRHPFAGENLLELLERAEAGIFLPPGTPAALAELCAQALALDPAQRPSDGAAFARALVAAQAELEPTTERFADYTLGAELGRGCSGVVYRAREPRLNRDVALKVLHLRTDQDRERFLREAEAMARVQHPNLVRVHASGLEGERAFLAMELIEGEPLPERQVAPRRAAEVTQQLARALEALHAAGVVHRDVKPQNTLCARDGRVCLSDLGLARLSESSRLTATRAFVGTPAYAALEQFHSSRVTPAADVYALGAMLYMLLTGGPPGGECSSYVELMARRAALPRPPSELGGDPALDAVCLAALRPDPQARPSARELAWDLERYLRGELRPLRRQPTAALAVAGAVALGLAAWFLLPRDPAAPAALPRALATRDLGQALQELEDPAVDAWLAQATDDPRADRARALQTLGALLEGGPVSAAREALRGLPASREQQTLRAAADALDSEVMPRRAQAELRSARQAGADYPELDVLEAIARARAGGGPAALLQLATRLTAEDTAVAEVWRAPARVRALLGAGRPQEACAALTPETPADLAREARLRAVRVLLDEERVSDAVPLARAAGPGADAVTQALVAEATARIADLVPEVDSSPATALAPEVAYEVAALLRLRAALELDPASLEAECFRILLLVNGVIRRELAACEALLWGLADACARRPALLAQVIKAWTGHGAQAEAYLELIDGARPLATPEEAQVLEVRRLRLLVVLERFAPAAELGLTLLEALTDRRERHEAAILTGRALTLVGRLDDALTVLEPEGDSAYLAHALALAERYREALRVARVVLDDAWTADHATSVAATAVWRAGREGGPAALATAREAFSRYQALEHPHPAVWAWAAQLAWQAEDLPAAAEALRAARRIGLAPPLGLAERVASGDPEAGAELTAWAEAQALPLD